MLPCSARSWRCAGASFVAAVLLATAASAAQVLPSTVRDGLDAWFGARLQRRAPLAVIATSLEGVGLSDDEAAWLSGLAALQPLVRVAAFCTYKSTVEQAGALGAIAFGGVQRLSAPGTGLEGDAGDRLQSAREMVLHLMTVAKRGAMPAPVFYGLVSAGASFPDAQELVDTLYGVAADIQEARLPASVAILTPGRVAESTASGFEMIADLRKARPGSASWRALHRAASELPQEPTGALSAVFFTPTAAEWDLHGGLSVVDPAHVGAIVRARRRAYALASATQQAGPLAALAAVAVVDASETVTVVRVPFKPVRVPAALLDGRGQPMPFASAEEAEMATFLEEVDIDGTSGPTQVVGHVVVGWRGHVSEILAAADAGQVAQRLRGGEQVARPAEPPTHGLPGGDGQPSVRTVFEPDTDPPLLLSAFTTLFDKDRSDPIGEQKYMIQRNTLAAFAALGPQVEMTVFTTSEQVERLCDELGPVVTCSRDFKTNVHGTPLLKSMFLSVERRTTAPFYGYLNADILFDGVLLTAIRTVQRGIKAKILHSRVLIVGRRTNFDMPIKLDADSPLVIKSKADLPKVRAMAARGRLFQTDAQDFFFIHRDSFHWSKIPDFVIGRLAYDNWLVDHAYHDDLDRVDISRTVYAVHQTGADGNKAGHKKRMDTDWNKHLVTKLGGGYDHGHTHHANWETRWHNSVMKLSPRPTWHSANRPSSLKE
ncbi:hypothetical protein FNF31_03621 [Cafeteria roenbergensis]|uniref:Uncharacterized protein n=1 Tax=Cafeteria roenbergensis TaxID=33653 RepID=A0A5A8D8U8_CAFRO|nr:hypothetical protein FNF31_03621 [Cafeteria roenbergensis]